MDLLQRASEFLERNDLEDDGDLVNLKDEDNLDENNIYQNENIYNRHLPYDIEAECQEHLMQIKTSLAKCIQLDQPTVYEWFIDLERFVDLYGLRFSKEDHIYFVKLLYELMVSKTSMDLYNIAYVARCFSRLMRKRYLISSEELQLDWRPLYETYERLLYSETETLGLRFVPENLESNLSNAIRLARPHFPIEATQEMLDEWRPMLCPFSVSIQKAITYLNNFLPTTLPPEHHDKGFKLWFDEVIQLWLSGKVCAATYESKFTLLLSRLSSDCMGFIDWNPYIPRIFNHFKTSLNLNGGMSRAQFRRPNDSIDVGPCVQWMIYMISKQNSCLEHISMLFKAIESFYHPSNTDRRWHTKLQQFLYKLPSVYVKRLYRERVKKNIWSKRIPENYKLTEEMTTKFVDALMPVVLTSMFNQAGIGSAALAFRDLSVLRPEKVIPPLLDRLYGSYETLVEPHRLLASIYCMASVVPAMVRPCKYFPQGPNHVVPLLLNSLPGIDSNDIRKCIAVFRFIASLAAHIRIKSYVHLVDERPELTVDQQQLCLLTGQFEEFVVEFLDRCFVLIENVSSATFTNLDQEGQLKNGEEGIVEAAISSVAFSVLSPASPEIQKAALDKIYYHVIRHIFDTKTQGKAIATLCLVCAKSYPEETLKKFMPHYTRLIKTLTSNDEVFQESTLDEELLFSLLLLSEIVRCNNNYILDYKESIIEVLQRALKLTAKEGYMFGCAILRHLLRALTNIACCDWRNIDFDNETNKAIEERWPFDNWGHTTHIKDLKLKWEIPGPESRQFAQELLETFMKDAVEGLVEWSQNKRNLSRDEVQRSLHIILSSLVGGASVLPSLQSKVIHLCPYEVPVTPMYVNDTGTEPLNFKDGTNIRTYIMEKMYIVLNYMMITNEDDFKSMSLLSEIFGTAISYYGFNKTELRLAAQRIKTMKGGSQNKLLGSKRYLRYLIVERVAQQHRAMLMNKGQPYFTELHLRVFKSLFQLAQSHYNEVRILAQDTVYLILNYFPFSETILVPMLVEELRKEEIEHNKFKGLLYLVIGRRTYSSIAVDPNWSVLKELWPALVESQHSEKPSIVKLMDRVCSLVQKSFDTFELRYNFCDEVKKIALEFWSREDIDKTKYPPPGDEMIKTVRLKVEERNDKSVRDYEQLVLKLVELIENPHLHWNRRIVAYSLFSHLMRDDHPLPLRGLQLCLSSLISDRLSIRVKAIHLTAAQLKLHKRPHKKRKIRFSDSTQVSNPVEEIEMKTETISLDESSNQQKVKRDDSNSLIGERDLILPSNNNKWMQYKLIERNYTKEEWDKLIFIDKPHLGFYIWPKTVDIYETFEYQPKLNRSIEELNEFEAIVYRKFTDAGFVDKLVEYFCFEDHKGLNQEARRFDIKRPNLFKCLFRNYGPCMIEPFRKYLVEYATSTCDQKQKFVIEFLAGLMRGSKHWSYEMMLDLEKLVLTTLDRIPITQENFNDWTGFSNYVFRHRDLKRFNWLLNYFVTKIAVVADPNSTSMTPFIQSSRLTLAHYSLIQCEWRAVDHIFPYVLENLKPRDHLLSYANVRTCLASIFSLIYMYDDAETKSMIPGTLADGPKRIDFIDLLVPKLAILEKYKGKSPSTPLQIAPSQNLIDKGNLADALGKASHSTNLELSSIVHAIKSGSIGANTAAALVAAAKSVPMDVDSKDGSDMVLLAETLLRFRDQELNNDSPKSVIKNRIYLNKEPKELEASPVEQTISSTEIASFVENLKSALPGLASSISQNSTDTSSGGSSEDSQERKDAIKLMKLTSSWIIYNVCRMKSPVPKDFFKLLPVICEMGREGNDQELAADSLAAVAMLGSSILSPEAVDESLICVRRIIAEHSWHARVAAAAFIEILVSSNLFKLLNNQTWRGEIEDIVMNELIRDERIEVRESSSLTLSGMIHCEFTMLTPELLNEFKRRANHPLIKRKQPNGTTVIESSNIVTRHSGILCLCACVDAYPYTVPDYLPEILTLLSDHLTDPQPISTTIKKTMSNFRRTHHDNWQSDKTKFTDDQLCTLADLLVSPCYYA